MMSETKGIEAATVKSVEITFDVLNGEELQNEFRILKDVFEASYGPSGRLNLVQHVSGGHVTATSNSSRILNSLTTVSSPVTQLLLQAVKGHLSNFNDGGLFTGLLTLELIESSLKSSSPRHTVIQINEHSMNLILQYLQSASCKWKISADLGNMHQMLSVIKSILQTKSATGISCKEVESLAILLLHGFLKCVPSSEMKCKSITLENLRIHGCEGPATSESSIIQGILLDVRCFPEYDYLHENTTNRDIKVALFDSSLAGNVEDAWYNDKAQTEVSNSVTNIEDSVLESMMDMVDTLIQQGVRLVACQKVIHPTLQRYLTKKGLYFIERLSICHIEAVRELTGATLLSSFLGKIDFNSFGSLAQIEPKVIHQKRYLHLIPQLNSQPISTLMLCAPDETALDELQLVCSAVLNALKELVYHSFVVPGGGCFETNVACFLIQNAKVDYCYQDLGCSKGQYSIGLHSVASAFLRIARNIDHNNVDHLVDMATHHHWISQSPVSLKSTQTPWNCLCGLVTSDQDTEWFMTEELFCKPVGNFPDGQADRSGLGAMYKNAILDVMSVKVNGIRIAFETANTILRVKHFLKETV